MSHQSSVVKLTADGFFYCKENLLLNENGPSVSYPSRKSLAFEK
ncbi:hypothetical protein [Tetragenococcus koreensis]|nr:hypothetical protein [Tetragenococcus koreensis]